MSAQEELERLEAVEQDATPGPWVATMSPFVVEAPDAKHTVCRDQFMRPEDRTCIVAARTALPAALACLTELLALEDATLTCANDHDERWCGYCENRRDAFAEVAGIVARHFPGEQA